MVAKAAALEINDSGRVMLQHSADIALPRDSTGPPPPIRGEVGRGWGVGVGGGGRRVGGHTAFDSVHSYYVSDHTLLC